MPKQEQPKLEDTNMANYGSKDHRDLKKSAAQTEEAWKEAGKKVGVQVWRIEKFKVKAWDKEKYGSFFSGDAYIVLNTYHPKDEKTGKESDKFAYDVHFWLGKTSTQDEQGTAAYKTVELDDLLDDVPVQFRQVQGHESKEFLGVFGTVRYMEGGVDSGFNHVKPTEYKTRLLQVHGVNAKYVRCDEVAVKRESLNMGDVFVLDGGLQLWQWNGSSASVWEKRKAEDIVKAIIAERNGKPKKAVLDGNEDDATFWKHLGGKGTIAAAKAEKKEVKPATTTGGKKGPVADKAGVEAEAPKNDDENWDPACIKELYRVEVAGSKITFKPVARGGEKVLKSKLDTKGTFVLDVEDQDKEHHVYIWVGKQAGKEHQKKAIEYGLDFVKQFKLKDCWPIARVVEGSIHRDVGFTKAFDG